MTLIPTPPGLHVLDADANSIVKLPSHLEKGNITIIGTFNGIVILLLEPILITERMVLYNPFTGASKRLPASPSMRYDSTRIFGFGYGATPDDVKIIIGCKPSCHYRYNCDVLCPKKKGSWTTFSDVFQDVMFKDDDVGVFLNGFLHWVSCDERMMIVALDLKKMVASMMNVPDQCNYLTSFLGTLHGRLCMIDDDESPNSGFDVWTMEKQGVDKSWSKKFSLTLGWAGGLSSYTICILEDGKIVVRDGSLSAKLIIYDTSDGSYRKLDFQERSKYQNGIEYVETLVSPSDICGFV